MDKGVTCEHLNKLVDVLGKELWQSSEELTCFDCGACGPNLWICLQPDCHHIGCSEVKNDHSTIHQKNYTSHCVHMNVSTERIWCYLCEKEVHIRAAVAHAAMCPDSTTLDSSIGARLGSYGISGDDDLDPDDMDYDDDTQSRGLVGLQNMGNTCYMNAALQALSNSQPFTSYFLECAAAVAVLAGDKKPGLSRAYQKLIKEMWSKKTRGYLVPNGILYGIRNVYPMFRGYQQHDTQEFLRCFMDQLHEELKEPMWETSACCEADGDHSSGRVHVRRRAASSGASDAPYFVRTRRASPASEGRPTGYNRVQSSTEGGNSRHRRSASFAGTHQFTYNALTHTINGAADSQRDVGSESELSCSSEPDERYETCSSGSEPPDTRIDSPESFCRSKLCGGAGGGDGGRGARYRSIVSDVFDGKLLSSVQCLICDRVSTRVETFQDLSLPIPSREHLAVLRCQQPILNHHVQHSSQESWVWWVLSWLRSWFYGPVVSLQDCLAAFFSADELKGDNMYSCSRCNKLRNGVKMSGVVRLPEVLCVHLKRFRHELMFSAKVAARVSFPINDLNMAPYTHKECTSHISRYALSAVICHSGTAGGGHYTCVARSPAGWHAFDDAAVLPVPAHHLAACEAYVLFYRKVNPQMTLLRQKAAEILESTNVEPNDIKFYISKQWLNKFKTWAEPGPIENGDFVCVHGGVRPERAAQLHALAAVLPQPLWQFLHNTEIDGITTYSLKPGSDHAQLSEELWRFFTGIYGGGPEVRLRSPVTHDRDHRERDHREKDHTFTRRLSRKYSESDREEYCTKSTSEMNIRDSIHNELQKNQSLQNINRRHRVRSTESDEDVRYKSYTKRHETNGNCDSDEEMDTQPYGNTIRMENGIDSSENDANDNPVYTNKLTDNDFNIDIKNRKSGKVRKSRRRTVK
ncbi:PREDICTED: ubiquitin carboxyl-terminal hydrolase 20 [Papilio polytes]|uniref:ubiquitin carboxyl-terminal hydrolase 20 n=1 Tax=Papilio polytes TaxID=76194 RepID=UPI0006763AE8|nr:PREDICTED: ubiquitin carboxyl-terminal hydrolase 20 [Papilio polytes]